MRGAGRLPRNSTIRLLSFIIRLLIIARGAPKKPVRAAPVGTAASPDPEFYRGDVGGFQPAAATAPRASGVRPVGDGRNEGGRRQTGPGPQAVVGTSASSSAKTRPRDARRGGPQGTPPQGSRRPPEPRSTAAAPGTPRPPPLAPRSLPRDPGPAEARPRGGALPGTMRGDRRRPGN